MPLRHALVAERAQTGAGVEDDARVAGDDLDARGVAAGGHPGRRDRAADTEETNGQVVGHAASSPEDRAASMPAVSPRCRVELRCSIVKRLAPERSIGVQPRCMRWLVLALIGCTSTPPHWHVDGGALRDPDGRAAILRGVNLSGTQKMAPYLDGKTAGRLRAHPQRLGHERDPLRDDVGRGRAAARASTTTRISTWSPSGSAGRSDAGLARRARHARGRLRRRLRLRRRAALDLRRGALRRVHADDAVVPRQRSIRTSRPASTTSTRRATAAALRRGVAPRRRAARARRRR